MGLAGFALESDTCSGAGAAGRSALSVHGQAAPTQPVTLDRTARERMACLTCSPATESVPGTGNSLKNFSTWKSRAFFPQLQAPAGMLPLLGETENLSLDTLAAWKVKVLLCA